MTLAEAGEFRKEHLDRWWVRTREYLFADVASLPGNIAHAPCPMTRAERRRKRLHDVTALVAHLDGAQEVVPASPSEDRATLAAMIAWAHQHMLRLLRHATRANANPLRVLEGVFYFQISFVAKHPAVPAHLLACLAPDGDPEIQGRIRSVLGHYETKLARLIERARRNGLVRAAVDPRAAARLFIAMLHSLLLRMRAGLVAPQGLRNEAARLFPVYMNGIRDGLWA